MYQLKERIVFVCNRTTVPLEVMHDGMVWTIRPGYVKLPDGSVVGADEDGNPSHDGRVFLEPLPYYAAERAMRQNPQMGTADPLDPRAFTSLIGVPKWDNDYTHIEQSDALELLDVNLLEPQLDKNGRVMPREVRHIRGMGHFRAPGRPKDTKPLVRIKNSNLAEGFQGAAGYNPFQPISEAYGG